jgi:hypothetical protein
MRTTSLTSLVSPASGFIALPTVLDRQVNGTTA